MFNAEVTAKEIPPSRMTENPTDSQDFTAIAFNQEIV